MENTYLSNFSYLFVPFTTESNGQFPELYKRISQDGSGWIAEKIENRYLHRYVLEKIEETENGCATHFLLNSQFAKAQGVHLDADWYGLNAKKYKEETDVHFDFMISNVELFAFRTSVCVLVFELRFRDNDPRKIAAAQYYLRKISTEQIYRLGDSAQGESFVDISAKLLQNVTKNIPLDFFFYSTPNNEKANFLTYIDVPEKDSYAEDLFYLKWCYSDGFEYDDEGTEDDSVTYPASKSILWGISVSAAACLVQRTADQKEFIENVFQKNFRNQYLLTYMLLLHQKYMMYLFLTKMSVGLEGNLVQLEKYKALLYDFQSHYMFTYISEIPQYQRFYQKVRQLFFLDGLFQDVQEPLLQLTEIKKQKADEERQEYDYRINTVLTTLSLLTIVSALTDATGITANLTWFIPEPIAKIIQLVMLGGVAIISLIMLIRLLFLKKH